VLTLGAAEVFFRTFAARRGHVVLDDELGWRPAPNYQNVHLQENQDGTTYHVSVTQDERGFRAFGDPASDRPKVFVIGDSFTQATHVSDNRTYYAVMGECLDAEVFAWGLDGAGTLQEYMAVDRYLDEIRPDLVVWQYCSNDFVNNSYQLELNSEYNNNGLIRPYLEGDRIVYRMPKPYPGLVSFLSVKSYLVRFVLEKVYRIEASRETDSIEREMGKYGLDLPEFNEAFQVTGRLMQQVKQRAGDVPVVTFECDTTSPKSSAALREVSSRSNLAFVHEVDEVLTQARKGGAPIFVADGAHWNEAGHELVGETLSSYLAREYADLFVDAGGVTTYDLVAHLADAGTYCGVHDPDFVHVDSLTIDGRWQPVLFEHPDSRVCYQLSLDAGTTLAFDLALAPETWDKAGDGVDFAIYVESDRGTEQVFGHYIDPKQKQEDRRWHPFTVDLSDYHGPVTLIFETGGGPAGDTSYDWAVWGNLRLFKP